MADTRKTWLILSCLHWYKTDNPEFHPSTLRCPTCQQQVDVLDRVPLSPEAR